MSTDPYIKDHQAWLGALQPDGLVVSPAALVDAQAILNIRGIETQQRFVSALGVIKHADVEDQPAITDFAHFARTFLEWPDECLFAAGDAARPLPDRLLIETDAPFLCPEPHRGERNEPAYVRYVAEKIAALKNMTFDEVAEATTRNARELFRI